MVLRQMFCRFTGSAAQTHCGRRPQFVSTKIFGGRNFRGNKFSRAGVWSRKSRNFYLAKIFRYTALLSVHITQHIHYTCAKTITLCKVYMKIFIIWLSLALTNLQSVISCSSKVYSGELRPGSVFLARAPRLRTHAACGFVVSVIITWLRIVVLAVF